MDVGDKMILGVTLARGGSKSIPLKNISPINGIPLLAYTIMEAQKSEFIDHYLVNTDSEEIAAVAKQYGADVQFGRPEYLCDDTASSGDTLKYVVERFEETSSLQPKIVVELMATNPLKSVLDIDGCIEKYKSLDADSVVAMGRLYDHHPSRIKFLDDDGRICDFYLRFQSLQTRFVACGLCASRIHLCFIEDKLNTGIRYGGSRSFGYRLPDERFLNIDEPRDLLVAETLLSI